MGVIGMLTPLSDCRNVWLQDIETGSPVTTCHRGRSAAMPRAWGAPEDPTVQS